MHQNTRDSNEQTSGVPSKVAPAGTDRAVSSWRRIPHTRIALAVAAALTAILAVIGLSEGSDVPAVVVDATLFSAQLSARGRLDADGIATVGATGPGRVTAVLVRAGDSVTAGDPLLRLDAEVAREQYRSAAAAAASSGEGVRSARAELAGAEALLAERRRDHERIAPLAGAAVPAADAEAARAAVTKAEADAERATARLAQAEDQAAAAAADRDATRRMLEDLVLRSPITGVVVSSDADPGDVVGAGTPLFRLADPATLEVVAYLDETALGGLRVGLPVRISSLATAGRATEGIVKAIGREVDPETREVEVIVGLEEAPAQWALGQRVDVRLYTDPGPPSTTLPAGMVSWQGREAGVYVAEGGRARWVPVELGRTDGDRIELARGVSAGDTVLAPTGLRDGARVAPIVGPARGER